MNKQKMTYKIAIKVTKTCTGIALVGFLYLYIFKKIQIGIPCVFRKITGYKCPGCGMTHAMERLWSGDLKGAVECNALSITVLPIVCIYLLYRIVREETDDGKEFYIWEYILLLILFIGVMGYGYIRNNI